MGLKKRPVLLICAVLLAFSFGRSQYAGVEPSPFKIKRDLKTAIKETSLIRQQHLLQSALKNLSLEKKRALQENKNRALLHIKMALRDVKSLLGRVNLRKEEIMKIRNQIKGHITWALSYVYKIYPDKPVRYHPIKSKIK